MPSESQQHLPFFFLKIAEIKGNARPKGHEGETEVVVWSWGETQSAFPSEARQSGGSVSMRDLHFTAMSSPASPQFMLHCAAAKRFKTAILTCEMDTPKGRQIYLTITLSNVIVGSFDIEGDREGGLSTDRMTLKFTKIEFNFTPPGGGNFSCSWDLSQNS